MVETNRDESPSPAIDAATAAANRRWIITICVSLVFGIFGAVMALLSYSGRAAPAPAAMTAAPAAAPAAPDPDPTARGRGKKHGRE